MDRVVLLDTHVLVWRFLEPRKLSRPAARALEKASRKLLADISLREVTWSAHRGRIELDRDPGAWLEQAIDELSLEVVPISPAIAARSCRVGQDLHADPADQLIAATAVELDVPLVTADERLLRSPALRCIW